MMHLGFSKSWPEALEGMTGTPEMSAKSFIKYFLPLYDFLDEVTYHKTFYSFNLQPEF
jgi:hypothetical protein